MSTVTQNKGSGEQTSMWFVRDEQGGRYGPVEFETLKAWACDGRIGPTNEVSGNGVDWTLAAFHRELEMEWVAEVTPGRFYGPIHRNAMRELVRDGSIAGQASLFRRRPMNADGEGMEAKGARVCAACTRMERELKQARGESETQAQACQQAQQRAAAYEVELQRLRQVMEAQVRAAEERAERERGVADDALRAAHDKVAEWESRWRQADQERRAAELIFAEQEERLLAQMEVLRVENSAVACERAAFQAEAERALAEAAVRKQRVAELESALLDASKRQDALAADANTLRVQEAAAQAALRAQQHVAEATRSRCAALQAEVELYLRTCDELRERASQMAKEGAEVRHACQVLEAEVLPPERSRAAPPPKDAARREGRSGPSLADFERQARLELERLGAHGPAFFAKKR